MAEEMDEGGGAIDILKKLHYYNMATHQQHIYINLIYFLTHHTV